MPVVACARGARFVEWCAGTDPGTMNPDPGRSLLLQAYDGWDIPNSVDPDPAPDLVALARSGTQTRLLLAAVRALGPPTGRYNCHGLVLANRRTNIPPIAMPNAVDPGRLLQRDRFAPVLGTPQVGDVAVYRAPGGEIDHTGIVCRIERLGAAAATVFVWSMWGSLGEFEHQAVQSPYRDCAIEYWRLS